MVTFPKIPEVVRGLFDPSTIRHYRSIYRSTQDPEYGNLLADAYLEELKKTAPDSKKFIRYGVDATKTVQGLMLNRSTYVREKTMDKYMQTFLDLERNELAISMLLRYGKRIRKDLDEQGVVSEFVQKYKKNRNDLEERVRHLRSWSEKLNVDILSLWKLNQLKVT